MNGYLQRIAASVLQPARAIHPTVGSIWVAPRKTDPIETASALSAPAPHVIAHAEPPAQSPAQTTQDETKVSAAVPFAAKSLIPEPAQPDLESKTISASVAHRQPLVATENPSPISRINTLEPNADPQAEATKTFPRPPFTPLIAEVPHQPAFSLRASPLGPLLHRERLFRPQPIAQSTREPDEIEIHIGRIEVTAALPQPAPRPAAQSARKSLDLGEYLKRDRRTR